jgi:chromosome condensin MukBEF complex kleisin-like MukF subunit
VILYLAEGDPLGHVLLRRCREADYDCHLLHNESQVIENLTDLRHQTVVLVDAKITTHLADNTEYNNLEHLSQ